ncbi:MAG: DNA repair protein RadC [Erysipelotrichaceae bacterium]|nr:DNA repair protein RadC [Erysipelotrichaceae bacterium]
MSENLMPREKAINYGFSSLSNNELIALILKSAYKDKNVFSLTEELLEKAGGFNNLLSLNYDELVSIKGIKKAKALEILAILEVSKRLSKVDSVSQNNSLNPLVLVDFLRFSLGFSSQEEFFVVFLGGNGRIIKACTLFKGTGDKAIVGVDEIYRNALLLKARAIVIAHNHPSGNTSPSPEDRNITERIKKGCDLIGISLLDHIIISNTSYYSFKSNNLL